MRPTFNDDFTIVERGLEQRKDLPVSDNRDWQYSCEGYMALTLVV
jgi:hypothetical protein